MEKLFILYDGRAKSGNTDRASVFVTASSEKEAQRDGRDPAWQDGIWYEYDCLPNGVLANGRQRWDIAPNKTKRVTPIACDSPDYVTSPGKLT